MTDETGESLRLSMTVWMTGALLAVVVGVTVFSLLIFNRYTSRYSDAMIQATASTLYNLSMQTSVTCPQAYSSITAAIAEVDRVMVKMDGETSYSVYYSYDDLNSDRMIELMTGINSTKNVRLTIESSNRSPAMVVIKLEEVVR